MIEQKKVNHELAAYWIKANNRNLIVSVKHKKAYKVLNKGLQYEGLTYIHGRL